MLVLYEQKKQRCMIKLNLFGEIPDESSKLHDSDATLKKAVEFMTPLCIDFAANKIKANGLRAARNEALKKMGKAFPPKGVQKTGCKDTGAIMPDEKPNSNSSK